MSDETPTVPGGDTPEVTETPRQPIIPSPGPQSPWPTAPSSRRSDASGAGADAADLPRTAPTFRPLEPKPDVVESKPNETVAPEPAAPETSIQTLPAGRPILKSRTQAIGSQPPTTPAPLPESPQSPAEPAPTQEPPTTPDVPAAATPMQTIAAGSPILKSRTQAIGSQPPTTPAPLPESFQSPGDNGAPTPIPAPEPPLQAQAQPGDTSAETQTNTPVAGQTPEPQWGAGGYGGGGIPPVPPTPPTPGDGEPEWNDDAAPELATAVIAGDPVLVETEEKPEKKKRKGLIWFILAAILLIVAIVLLLTQCFGVGNSNPHGYPLDLDNNIVTPEDPAIMDPEFQRAADAIGDVYQGGFVVEAVGLNVPLGEVNAVEGVLNPPGFDRAYVVRNMGVLPPDATRGTVYIVLHTIVGGRGPGNFLIDPPRQTTTLKDGDLIKVGNLTYKFTGSRLVKREELSANPDLWTSDPNRLIIITCMLNPDININTITDNMVIFGELVS